MVLRLTISDNCSVEMQKDLLTTEDYDHDAAL